LFPPAPAACALILAWLMHSGKANFAIELKSRD
jgi:hypothetical protein